MTFDFSQIPAFNKETGLANAIIDTPKGSRNKYKFDEEKGLFKLKHVLALGLDFPFDFGFLPNTLTEDGDPLDIMVLLDMPAFAGCLVEVRIIGVLEATQTGKDGETEQNDRLIGVFAHSQPQKAVKELSDLPKTVLDEIEHFFRSYNEMRGINFKIKGRAGSQKALQLIQKAIKAT